MQYFYYLWLNQIGLPCWHLYKIYYHGKANRTITCSITELCLNSLCPKGTRAKVANKWFLINNPLKVRYQTRDKRKRDEWKQSAIYIWRAVCLFVSPRPLFNESINESVDNNVTIFWSSEISICLFQSIVKMVICYMINIIQSHC